MTAQAHDHDAAVAAFGECPTCALLAQMATGAVQPRDARGQAFGKLAWAQASAEQPPRPIPEPRGATYRPKDDQERLGTQAERVWAVMRDGEWRTLAEVGAAADAPEASVSARLRDFRRPEWGAQTVERRHRGAASAGLHEYRLIRRQPEPEGYPPEQ